MPHYYTIIKCRAKQNPLLLGVSPQPSINAEQTTEGYRGVLKTLLLRLQQVLQLSENVWLNKTIEIVLNERAKRAIRTILLRDSEKRIRFCVTFIAPKRSGLTKLCPGFWAQHLGRVC